MSKCKVCHVEIKDESSICPLCHSVIEQNENSENFYLEYMDFSFLVPIYGYYEKGIKNKDFLALGLKLRMLDRIL